MSSAFPSDQSAGEEQFGIESIRTAVEYPARMLGFWTAIVLPFVLLVLIVLGVAQQSPTLTTGLVTANIAGLVLGKDYKR